MNDSNFEQLSSEVERIREKGITLGLDDRQMDQALKLTAEKCFANKDVNCNACKSKNNELCTPREKNVETQSSCFIIRQITSILWKCTKWTFMLLLLSMVVYSSIFLHEPTSRFVESIFTPHSYHFLRLSRLITYPWVKKYDVKLIHSTECLLPNPYFQPEIEPIDCAVCRYTTLHGRSQRDGLDEHEFAENYYNQGVPLLRIEDAHDMITSLFDLSRLYKRNSEKIESSINVIHSTDPRVTSLQFLMENVTEQYVNMDSLFHAEWHSQGIWSSRVLRRLFPRPYFLHDETQVVMSKMVIIDAQKALPYAVPRPLVANSWYVQASGSRRLVVVATEYCRYDCQPVHINMWPGQMLYVHDPIWSIDSLPVFGDDALDQLSIAFIGSFV